MKTFILACLVAAAVAEADPYTVGQVLAGAPWANAAAENRLHNPGVITNFPAVTYAGFPYISHVGKRSADPEADAYTVAQVAAGLPQANAIATGNAHNPGVLTATGEEIPAVTSYKLPPQPYLGYAGYAGHYGYPYLGYGYHGLGKRSADPEADAYTIGQVYAGQTNGGLLTGVDYGNGLVSGLGAIGNRDAAEVKQAVPVVPAVHATYAAPLTAYTGYAGYPFGVNGVVYGK